MDYVSNEKRLPTRRITSIWPILVPKKRYRNYRNT